MNVRDGRLAIESPPGDRENKSAPPPRDPRLVQALEEYLAALEAGNPLDRQQFLARHAGIAAALAECLDGLDFIRSAASQVREPAGDRAAIAADRPAEIQPEGPLGDFRIVREIGRGGMGVVYEAVQISLGRKVALKVLPFAAALDHKQLQRFKNEAQAAATLHHTNIVPVHWVGNERGVHFYAMQLIEGQSLAVMIRELRQLEGLSPDAGEPAPGEPGVGERARGEPEASASGLNQPDHAGRSPIDLARELASGHWAPAKPRVGEPGSTAAYSPAPARQSPAARPDSGTLTAHATTPPAATLSTQRSHQSSAFFRSVANLGVQAAEALEHAHSLGVVHRDIKPANLLVDVRGNLWITDFGLAQIQTDAGLTMTGDLLGTIRYMSPEQALAKRVLIDHRTDIYSLGVTLYELFTLEPAYAGRDRHELLKQIAFEEPSPPHRLNKSIPLDLETIVLKSIAKNPDERYAAARDLADDLARFLKDEPIRAKRPTLVQRARKWARRHQPLVRAAIAFFLLAVMALAASTLFVWRAKNDAERALDRERYGAYIQRLGLAEREFSVNNLARAEELLEQCPVALRGWEWRYLKRQRCQSMVPIRFSATVTGVSISPDGKWIASSDADGWIRIWDIESGRELRSVRAFPAQAYSAVFSPDGQRVACCSFLGGEEVAKVFDARTMRELAVMPSPIPRSANAVVFSHDGRQLISGGDKELFSLGGALTFWDAATGEQLASMDAHRSVVSAMAISPDGRLLASGGNEVDRSVKIWNVETRREILTFGGHQRDVSCVAFSPDSRLVASGGGNWGYQKSGEVKLWDAVTGREKVSFRGHFDGISSIAFSPDGRRLVTGGNDFAVKIWDVATGEEMLTLRGHSDWVMGVAVSPDGERLVSAGCDRTLRLWDGRPLLDDETCQEILTLRGHEDGVNSVAYSPDDGRRIASGSADGTVRIWDAWTGKELRTFRVTAGQVTGLAFSADGKQVALATRDATEDVVMICDAESGREIQARKGPDESLGALCLAFSPNGKQVAWGAWDLKLTVWNLTTGELVRSPQQIWPMLNVAFSQPDGDAVASAGEDGTVRLWDAATAQEIVHLVPEHVQGVHGVVFSHDGKLLVTSSWDRTVMIWQKTDDGRWERKELLRDPTGGAEGVAISPDGRHIAWGSTDSTVKVWHTAGGAIETLRGHLSLVHAVAFSPDGQRIASASQDGTIKVWEVPTPPQK